MLVIFLYMEVLLFSNQKVPYKACRVSKPTSYKNAQHQNQLRCWSTEAPVLFVSINVFGAEFFNRRKKAGKKLWWNNENVCYGISTWQLHAANSKTVNARRDLLQREEDAILNNFIQSLHYFKGKLALAIRFFAPLQRTVDMPSIFWNKVGLIV